MAGETERLKQAFSQRFPGASAERLFRAPGRVNLIGEHTDYNLGYVLPIALDLACFVATSPAVDGKLHVHSENFGDLREWPVADLASLKPTQHWSDYVIGVAQQLLRSGVDIPALNLVIYSTVPVGSGLSSSASLEVSSALALLQGGSFDPTELARLAQRAEREFVGVPCGIMDQYVSVFGEENRAIRIDCRTVTHTAVSLPADVSLIAVNSMVKHDLGESAYAARVRECSEAVEIIKLRRPDVQSLRDVSSSMLEGFRGSMPDTVLRRATHVTTENERVLDFMKAAESANLQRMGRLFLASHRSLQHDYEVSCEELDLLVEAAADFTGVFGSRMTGGGFGGCTVNLIDPERVPAFEEYIRQVYWRKFKIELQLYRCVPAAGAGEIPA